MTIRKKFINYVKHGEGDLFCSPQIGAGAGFDTKMVGNEWISETSLEDLKNTVSKFDMLPLFNIGLPDISVLVPDVKWETIEDRTDGNDRKFFKKRFTCSKGNLEIRILEEKRKGTFQTKYLITEPEELDILEFYLQELLRVDDFSPITSEITKYRQIIGEEFPMNIQWAMQPYELLCFPDTMNTVIFAHECPEQFKRLMDKILELDEKLLRAVSEGGSDFVFLGGPGSEMISPTYYENYIVPYSKIVTAMAHEMDLLVYSHICSPIEPMLTNGYYNEMGIDLFETLSEKPVGNIISLEDAFTKLDPSICTRGNLGLDKLLNCTPEEIKEECMKILDIASRKQRKHILAASDYLFYDIPENNIHAMCDAVKEFYR